MALVDQGFRWLFDPGGIGRTLGLDDLPVIGDLLYGESPEDKLQKAFENAQKQQQAYRPMAAQANQQALGSVTSLFGPISQALESMYGPGWGLDTSGIQKSPISPEMLALGGPGVPKPQQGFAGPQMRGPGGVPTAAGGGGQGPMATMTGTNPGRAWAPQRPPQGRV